MSLVGGLSMGEDLSCPKDLSAEWGAPGGGGKFLNHDSLVAQHPRKEKDI